MKIKHLALENLTSLKGRHEIDFQKDLSGADLFAITGPTGSGKSSLLNAVSLALYARSAKTELSSQDFIAMGTGKASVKLEFYHMKDLYMATWSCRSAGMNGKPLKRPQVKRDLFVYNTNVQDWEVLETSVEEILQLSYEQFTRSVVLNQGEFARFLTSSFPERRQILERLYSGENLQALKTLLNEKLKKTQSEKELLDQQGQGLMPFSEEHYLDLKKEREGLLKAEDDVSEALNLSKKLLSEFDRFWDVLQQHQNTELKLESQLKLFEEQTQEVNQYKRQKQEKQEEHELAAQNYKKLKPILERVQEIAKEHGRQKEKREEAHQRKKDLKQSRDQKTTQLEKNNKQIESLNQDIQNLIEKLPHEVGQKTLEQKKQTRNELQLFLKVAPELKNTYNSQDQRIKHAQKELELKKTERDKTRAQEKASQKKSIELENKYLEEVKPFHQTDEIEKQRQQISLDLKEIEQKNNLIEENTKSLNHTQSMIQNLKRSIKKDKDELKDLDEKIAQIEEWKKLNELQASLESCIKQSLDEGQCFVCGTDVTQKILEHPLLKNNYSPDLIQLEKLKTQKQEKHQALDKDLLKFESQESKEEEINKLLTKLKDSVSSLKKHWNIQEENEETTAQQLDHKKIELENKLQKCQSIQQELDQERIKIKYAQETHKRIDSEIENREQEITLLQKSLKETHQKMRDERKKIQHLELPESFTINDYEGLFSALKDIQNQENSKNQLVSYQKQMTQDIESLDQQIQQEDKRVNQLEISLQELFESYKDEKSKASLPEDGQQTIPSAELAKKKALELEKSLEAHQAKLNEYTQVLQNVELQQNQTRGQISLQKERLKDLGELFTHHKMNFIKVLKQLKENNNALEMKENWENKFQNLEVEQASEEQKDALKAFYDDKLQSFFEKTELEHSQTKEKLQELKAQIELYNSKQNQKAELLKKGEEISQKLEGLQKLHSLIGRDEFRNFALAMIERDLIRQTNVELEKICQGRYRIDFSVTSNAQEFSLIDYWQGAQQRKISTLSGGETFLVSLAMALSLAEMSRGETEINSFFIDEGFGSLDQDSLEEVIETLSHIRSRGKQIGIISHVKELTQRIDVNIDLIKNQHGESHIQVLHN